MTSETLVRAPLAIVVVDAEDANRYRSTGLFGRVAFVLVKSTGIGRFGALAFSPKAATLLVSDNEARLWAANLVANHLDAELAR